MHALRSAALIMLMTPMLSNAAILDFDSFVQPSGSYACLGAAVTVDGFSIASSRNLLCSARFGPGNVTSTLIENWEFSRTTIRNVAGMPFDVTGMDIISLGAAAPRDFAVTFSGARADGSSIQQTLTFSNTGSGAFTILQPASLTGFTALSALSFTQGQNSNGTSYGFANVGVSPVPESSSFALLIVGLASIFGVVLRRQRSERTEADASR